ncbi:MAG: 23S rRNA (uracil(1939)-C(5))-methyltransferase RlmD [Atopobiaceae bacterium]|nr:23S rRNA (uracil(1939)-C(5))-methyltransferase RlmD [Atopobiaceae bacterium]
MTQADELTLKVERMAYGADAIAHADNGKTVFVQGGLAGDVVRAQVVSEGDSFLRARALEVLEASPNRVTATCPYVDVCGGCPWAHLSRDAQLAAKRSNVVDALTRIGHVDHDKAEALVAPCEAPGDGWGYRNKVELAHGIRAGRSVIGMHGVDGGVVRVDRCLLLDSKHAKLVKAVSGALSYLSGSKDLGIERVGIRASRKTRDVEVALWTAPGPFPRAQVAKVLGDATKASSVVRVLLKGQQKARRVTGVERLSGKGFWEERVGGELMALSAPSFFQVNTTGAQRLVELVCQALQITQDDEAMDLYCGAGTFTLPLARVAAFVSAVESYGPAVRDLRRNLERARLDNVDAVGGDTGREFPDTDADVIVVDPPRAGLANEVVHKLGKQPARAIAYVSCDPATLARDLARFVEAGHFVPTSITPVDLFPQTFHVETVTILSRRQ